MKRRILLSIITLMAFSSLLVGCTKKDVESAPKKYETNASTNTEESTTSQIETKDEIETTATVKPEPTPEITEEPTTPEPTAPVEQTPIEPQEPLEEATTAPSTEPTTEQEQSQASKVASIEEIKTILNDESFDIIPLDTGDTVKYVQTNCNLHSGPGTNFDKIGSLKTNQEVIAHALAPTGELWCQLIDEKGNEVGYVYYDYIGDSKVQTQQKTQSQSAQPATEQKPSPQPTVQEEPVQQPVQPAPMPGGTFGDVPIGTPGDGSGANGWFPDVE